MSDSALSSSITSSFGVISASSDSESRSGSTSHMSDSDYEVVLVTQATNALNISDSDSGSLVDASTDFVESSDDEHIFVPNVSQSTPNTPRPPSLVPQPLTATPRLVSSATIRPIVESTYDSDADGSSLNSFSDSDSDDENTMHARSRTVTNISDRLEAPIAASASTATLMAHPNANASAATIRPAALTRSSAPRRLAGMHTPAITTNTIVGIVSAAPLSPPTPSDGGQIPYVPFTPAPTAMPAPASIPTGISRPAASTKKPSTPAKKTPPPSAKKPAEPAIPTGKVSKRVWSAMNVARLKLGFVPLQHALRKKRNAELKAAKKAQQETQPKPQVQPKATTKSAKKKAAKAIVAPRATVGGSPVSSEDERPRMRASMFSPTNGAPMRSESPDDEAAYDAAIQQLNDHMLSPPEHPTATYRYILNRALLLEFRICTPDTLPTSHGAAIAMVKNNIHINVLDYVTKRKEGFGGLRSVMLESAKALRKDVRKRKMPVKQVKSLGLNSLLIARH